MKTKKLSRHSVTAMFDRIAPSYDRINTILSFGIDRLWRKKIKRFLPSGNNLTLVDLATGTADQIIALQHAKSLGKFIGFDLSEKMLAQGLQKIEKLSITDRVSLRLGSALDIPLSDNEANCVTISFGIRNVTDPNQSLQEMLRILKPGGNVFILEFSTPRARFVRFFYFLYLRHILPYLGGKLSKDYNAYSYLNQTIEEFPSGDEFIKMMKKAGFQNCMRVPMSFGVVTLYIGEK